MNKKDIFEVSGIALLFIVFMFLLAEFTSCDRYSSCMSNAKDVAQCGKP